MKALLSLILLITSVNSFASVDSIKFVLELKEVEKLTGTLRAESFELSQKLST